MTLTLIIIFVFKEFLPFLHWCTLNCEFISVYLENCLLVTPELFHMMKDVSISVRFICFLQNTCKHQVYLFHHSQYILSYIYIGSKNLYRVKHDTTQHVDKEKLNKCILKTRVDSISYLRVHQWVLRLYHPVVLLYIVFGFASGCTVKCWRVVQSQYPRVDK